MKEVCTQNDRDSTREGRKNLKDREIKVDGSGGKYCGKVLGRKACSGPVEKDNCIAMLNGNPFGLSGRARGVDDVGQMMSTDLTWQRHRGGFRCQSRQRLIQINDLGSMWRQTLL